MRLFQVQQLFRVDTTDGGRWIEEPGATMACRETADKLVGLRRLMYGGHFRVAEIDLIEINEEFNQRESQ